MGPGIFVIAILGCADGGTACTPVTTLETRYQTEAQCSAATIPALEANSDFDYPTLVARCRSANNPVGDSAPGDNPLSAHARRG